MKYGIRIGPLCFEFEDRSQRASALAALVTGDPRKDKQYSGEERFTPTDMFEDLTFYERDPARHYYKCCKCYKNFSRESEINLELTKAMCPECKEKEGPAEDGNEQQNQPCA